MNTAFASVSRSLNLVRLQMLALLAIVPCCAAAASKTLAPQFGAVAYGLLVVAALSLLLGAKLEPGLRRLEGVRVRLCRHQTMKARRAMEA